MLRKKEREDPVEMGRQDRSIGPYRSAISTRNTISHEIEILVWACSSPWNAGHMARCISALGAPAYLYPVSLQTIERGCSVPFLPNMSVISPPCLPSKEHPESILRGEPPFRLAIIHHLVGKRIFPVIPARSDHAHDPTRPQALEMIKDPSS